MKRLHFYYTLIVCILAALPLSAQESGLTTISGVVKDIKSHHEVEYVNVTVPGTNLGTVTNMDGIFTIKLRNAHYIEFSRIGYETLRISTESLKKAENTIYLHPKMVMLSEVVVSPIDADKIVNEAIGRIKANYSKEPTMFTGFYRETIQKKKRYINISEAILNIFKSPYSSEFARDRVSVFKGRKIVSPRSSDTLSVKLEGGPTLALSLDLIKSPINFIDRADRTDYTYSFIDYVTIAGRNHYAIHFSPAHKTDYPLYEGILYIDQKDYSFSRMEFRLDVSDPVTVTNMILKKKPSGLIFKPLNLSYLIDYRRQGSCNYLNYIRADIRFRCDWHKKLFHTNYSVVSEMVMTDRQNNPTDKISAREAFKAHEVLSDEIANFYDADFWGDYNIIEPTESLEHAVQKLRKSYDKINKAHTTDL